MSFTVYVDGESYEFTVPAADGIMYCNSVMCLAAGGLAPVSREVPPDPPPDYIPHPPRPYVVGHRPLQDAAQWWFGARYKLMEEAHRQGHSFEFMHPG